MSKKIKFNLICDGKPVRTIEDLQNNFVLQDVSDYYNNKLLHRWLEVRGYDEELKAVSSIASSEPIEILKELIRIFNVSVDEKEVEKSVYMLQYLEERKECCAIYEQENYNANHIIEDYETGYRQLLNGIYENPKDVALIKASIAEITSNYGWVLELNHRKLFYEFQVKSPLALMCLLMDEKARQYYLPVEITDEDGNKTVDTARNADKKEMFDFLCRFIKRSDFPDMIKENLIRFSGVTDGYWKDLEPKGKKFMIISMGDGDYVRSAGQTGGDLSSTDITNHFVIVDGVDYKSNSLYRELMYMEV